MNSTNSIIRGHSSVVAPRPTDRPWCRPSGVNDLSPLSNAARKHFARMLIGVAPKAAWLSYLALSDIDIRESTLCMEEIYSSHGFENTPSDRLLSSNKVIHVSDLRTADDCMAAVDGMVFGSQTDFTTGDRDGLFKTLIAGIGDQNTVVLAARSENGDKGVFAYHRELTLYPDFTSFDVWVKTLEAPNNIVRAGLLATFFTQTIVDIETAVMSLARAGHNYELMSSIRVFNENEKLFTLLAERMSLASDESFDSVGGPIPDDVDVEPFYSGDGHCPTWVR